MISSDYPSFSFLSDHFVSLTSFQSSYFSLTLTFYVLSFLLSLLCFLLSLSKTGMVQGWQEVLRSQITFPVSLKSGSMGTRRLGRISPRLRTSSLVHRGGDRVDPRRIWLRTRHGTPVPLSITVRLLFRFVFLVFVFLVHCPFVSPFTVILNFPRSPSSLFFVCLCLPRPNSFFLLSITFLFISTLSLYLDFFPHPPLYLPYLSSRGILNGNKSLSSDTTFSL